MNLSVPFYTRTSPLFARPFVPRAHAPWLATAVALVLAALGWLAVRPAAMPQPLPASAPAAAFSAARALPHVAYLARAPRPIASAANREARDYIVGRLRAMGLAPQLHTATVRRAQVDTVGSVVLTAAVVNNIVLRVPGSAPGHAQRPALMLASHYDSGARSLGAADGGASVAALLETLRALQFSTPLASDLIVLIADGAAAGSLGARAFAEQHPWARQAGLVLNFDHAGSSGPLLLYDTHGGSNAAAALWARSAQLPLGSSLMKHVYPFIPNAKDTLELKRVGSAGLHFANLEGATGQQGALDTPGRLDAGTLQHTGDTMLALARAASAGAPAATAEGRVYFNLPGFGLVDYSEAAVWPLTRIICLLLFGVCCLALRRGGTDMADIANGAAGFIVIGFLLALGAYWLQLAPFATTHYNQAFAIHAHNNWHLLAFVALASGLFILAQRPLQAIIGASGAALGALLVLTVLLLLASWQMPGATYALAWPLVGALLAFGALQLPAVAARPHAQRVLILLLGAGPAVLLLAPLVKDVFMLIPGRTNPPIVALALLLGMLTALLAAVERRYMVRALALLCAVFLGVAGSARAPAEPVPQANRMTYYKDATTWQAYWLLAGQEPDGWSKQFFPDATEPRELTELFGHRSQKQWASIAPRGMVAFPYIEVLKDEADYVERHVEFMLQSKNAAPSIEVVVTGARPIRSRLNGRLLTSEMSQAWRMQLHGMGNRRLLFSFDMEGGKPFSVAIRERIPGLPAHGQPDRPGTMLPALTPMTETTIAADTLVFR